MGRLLAASARCHGARPRHFDMVKFSVNICRQGANIQQSHSLVRERLRVLLQTAQVLQGSGFDNGPLNLKKARCLSPLLFSGLIA